MPRPARKPLNVESVSFEEIISRAESSDRWEVSWNDENRRFILFTRMDGLSNAFYSPDAGKLNAGEFFHVCELLLKMTFKFHVPWEKGTYEHA